MCMVFGFSIPLSKETLFDHEVGEYGFRCLLMLNGRHLFLFWRRQSVGFSFLAPHAREPRCIPCGKPPRLFPNGLVSCPVVCPQKRLSMLTLSGIITRAVLFFPFSSPRISVNTDTGNSIVLCMIGAIHRQMSCLRRTAVFLFSSFPIFHRDFGGFSNR